MHKIRTCVLQGGGDLATIVLNDDCIVFLCDNGDAATINLMGSRIVEKLLSAGEEEMLEKIGQQYTGFPDNWQEEIKRFIDQLLQYGLIVKNNEC